MTAPSLTDLANAALDVSHIADVATSLALTSTDRLGHTKDTVAGAVAKVAAINNRGTWVTATAYATKDIVLNSGTWYMCVVAHTSSAAFATDLATKWRVYQGVTTGDLSASSGSALMGWIQSGTGAVSRLVQDRLRDAVSVKDFGALGDGTTNDTAALNLALAAAFSLNKKLYVPAGTYRYAEASAGAGYALLNKGVSIIGEGKQSVFFGPLAGMPSTADFMLLHPNASSDISLMEFSGFTIYPGFTGSVLGRRGIYMLFDVVTNLSKLHVQDIIIEPCNSWAVEIANTIATNPQGVPAYSCVENSLFYDGIKALGIGDSNTFRNNFHNTPSGSTRQGLWLYHVDGTGGVSSHSLIYGNAMDCDGGTLTVVRGRNVKFFWNNVEQTHGAGSNGAVIDIDGSGGTIPLVEIKGNHLGIFGTTTVTSAIRINGAEGAEVESNTLLSASTMTNGILVTSSAVDTAVGRNLMDTSKFTNPVNDSGTSTSGVLKLITLSGGASAAGSGYAAPAYYKTKENLVLLKGTITGVGIASGTQIGTLPAGVRPAAIERFTINATISGVATTAVIEITSAGAINYIGSGAATLICLSGLSFSTTPIVLSAI